MNLSGIFPSMTKLTSNLKFFGSVGHIYMRKSRFAKADNQTCLFTFNNEERLNGLQKLKCGLKTIGSILITNTRIGSGICRDMTKPNKSLTILQKFNGSIVDADIGRNTDKLGMFTTIFKQNFGIRNSDATFGINSTGNIAEIRVYHSTHNKGYGKSAYKHCGKKEKKRGNKKGGLKIFAEWF